MVPMKTNLGIVITQYDDSPNYNMTIAPTTLAKYSKYFNNGNNMDAMIMNSNGMTTKMAHGTLTPVSSPMKSSAANESTTSMEFPTSSKLHQDFSILGIFHSIKLPTEE